MESKIWFLDWASIPTVGSSIIIILGLWTIAQAIFNLLSIPPEYSLDFLFLTSLSPTNSNALSTASFNSLPLSPYSSPKKLIFSLAVKSSYIAIFCGTSPIFLLILTSCFLMLVPIIFISPEEGLTKPHIVLIVVLLPAPFGPRSPYISPSSMDNEILSIATKSSNFLTNLSISITFIIIPPLLPNFSI